MNLITQIQKQIIPDAPSIVKQRGVTYNEHRDSIKPLYDWKFYSANAVHISGVYADNHFSLSCTQRGTCLETNPLVCGGCKHPTNWQMWRKDVFLNIPVVTGLSYASGWEAEKLKYSKWRFLFRSIEYGYPIAWGAWRWQAAKNGAKY